MTVSHKRFKKDGQRIPIYKITFSITLLLLLIFIIYLKLYNYQQCFQDLEISNVKNYLKHRKTFITYSLKIKSESFLNILYKVLDRLGYKHGTAEDDWDLYWTHESPFYDEKIIPILQNLKPYQKVNKLPNNMCYTTKVKLATSGLKYILPAFQLPQHKEKLISFARTHPNIQLLGKNIHHRDIKIEQKISNINFSDTETFYQVFLDNPLLISGHKFDVGIYVIVTSISPLRAYIYNGEAGIRFCPERYHPFNASNTNKYVVGSDYLPLWDVPDIQQYYTDLGFGMKESLNAYLRSVGKNPNGIWTQIEDCIRTVLLACESKIAKEIKKYPSKRNFFEMNRFDFLIDEDLKVYLLEANMGPNLYAKSFPLNQQLFEQLLYNLFSLVGVTERISKNSLKVRSQIEEEMISANRNIAVFPRECASQFCKNNCAELKCQLCKNCLTPEKREDLLQAHKEFMNIGDCKRVFPPPVTKETFLPVNLDEYLPEDQFMYLWYKGKCLLDKFWCK